MKRSRSIPRTDSQVAAAEKKRSVKRVAGPNFVQPPSMTTRAIQGSKKVANVVDAPNTIIRALGAMGSAPSSKKSQLTSRKASRGRK